MYNASFTFLIAIYTIQSTVKLGYNKLYGTTRKSVRYNREIVITVKVYVVKVPSGTRKVELYLFVIAVNSL